MTLCWAGLEGVPALAGEYAFGGGYSLSHESNITRVPTGERREWIQALFGGIAYQEHTVDVNAQFLAQAERRDYVNNVYTDDTGAYLNGSGVWTLSPQRLAWSAEEVYREERGDIALADTPANRVRVSTLSTGPDFTIRLDALNTSQIGARYARFDIKNLTGDNQRRSTYARLLHRSSEQTTWSLNNETTRVEFKDQVAFPDVFRVDWFGRFETRALPNSMTIDAGTSRVAREGAADLNGRVARFSAARQLTSESALQVSYADQYSDTFTDTLRGVTSPTVPGETAQVLGTDVVTGDLYYSRRGELGYFNDEPGARFGYSLRGYARRVDYKTLNLDHKEQGGRADWNWRPYAEVRIFAQTNYLKREFRDFDQTDIDRTSSLGTTYSLTRDLTLTFEGTRLQHATTGPLGGFVDWRGMLLLGYSTGPLYAARSRR